MLRVVYIHDALPRLGLACSAWKHWTQLFNKKSRFKGEEFFANRNVALVSKKPNLACAEKIQVCRGGGKQSLHAADSDLCWRSSILLRPVAERNQLNPFEPSALTFTCLAAKAAGDDSTLTAFEPPRKSIYSAGEGSAQVMRFGAG